MTDSIGDFLTRVRNGYLAHKSTVELPHSKLKEAMARLFEQEKYVEAVEVLDTVPAKTLKITLKYINGEPALSNIKRLSKPGLRRYATVEKIPRILGGYGITLISTSQGVLTDKQAKAKGCGGELLCSIW